MGIILETGFDLECRRKGIDMILAIDIGNTNIVIGCIDGEKVCFVERVSTNLAGTELEYVVEFRTLFDLYHIGLEDISGSIISSVVPPLNNIVKSALEKLLVCISHFSRF